MRVTHKMLVSCLPIAMLVLSPGPIRAEVSVDPSESLASVIILGIIEGPDPIPQVLWEPVRDVDPARYLNPDGGIRGDGRPDVAIDPATGWPHVVWAYQTGGDHDIAYSRWTGAEWLDTVFLTSTTVDELDPRIFIDDSEVYVVWWEAGTERIWFVTQEFEGNGWMAPEMASPAQLSGRCPAIVSWGGTILIAAEKSDGAGGNEILFATRQGVGLFATETVQVVPQNDPLEIDLHTQRGVLWMDWRQSASSLL